MALIGGMLVRRAVPRLAAVYIPTSVVAGFLILLNDITGLSLDILVAAAGLIIWGVVRHR